MNENNRGLLERCPLKQLPEKYYVLSSIYLLREINYTIELKNIRKQKKFNSTIRYTLGVVEINALAWHA